MKCGLICVCRVCSLVFIVWVCEWLILVSLICDDMNCVILLVVCISLVEGKLL